MPVVPRGGLWRSSCSVSVSDACSLAGGRDVPRRISQRSLLFSVPSAAAPEASCTFAPAHHVCRHVWFALAVCPACQCVACACPRLRHGLLTLYGRGGGRAVTVVKERKHTFHVVRETKHTFYMGTRTQQCAWVARCGCKPRSKDAGGTRIHSRVPSCVKGGGAERGGVHGRARARQRALHLGRRLSLLRPVCPGPVPVVVCPCLRHGLLTLYGRGGGRAVTVVGERKHTFMWSEKPSGRASGRARERMRVSQRGWNSGTPERAAGHREGGNGENGPRARQEHEGWSGRAVAAGAVAWPLAWAILLCMPLCAAAASNGQR